MTRKNNDCGTGGGGGGENDDDSNNNSNNNNHNNDDGQECVDCGLKHRDPILILDLSPTKTSKKPSNCPTKKRNNNTNKSHHINKIEITLCT